MYICFLLIISYFILKYNHLIKIKIYEKNNFLIFILLLVFSSKALYSQENTLKIWFDKPAELWEAALPLGNGRLGAMPDGGIEKEKIVLNDISLWSGSPQEADMQEAYKYLPQIQEHLLKGENIEAQNLMNKYFKCEGVGTAFGRGANSPYGSYQILSNLNIDYNYNDLKKPENIKNYRRELSLNDAIAKTNFTIDGINFQREYFTSFDDDVIIIRLTASKKKKINFSLNLDRAENFTTKVEGKQLIMEGMLNSGFENVDGMKYYGIVDIEHKGGSFNTSDKAISITDANEATIYISATTNYKNENYVADAKNILNKTKKKTFEKEKENHIKNYRRLYNKAGVNIAGTSRNDLPTDERLFNYFKTQDDNDLINLYFQYGRYLLIGSTRDGLLAPNLQGLWANTIDTPWNGDYHLNINIQMNQWPMEVTNLGELNGPFYTLVNGLVPNGEKTAKAYYNGDGWVAHTISNLWGYTSPGEHYSWGSYNTGSAWMCQTLWNHYEYSKDEEYLKEIYPILKGSSEFYLTTMINETKNNWLVTSPSNSPENGFYMPNGEVAYVAMGPTIDNQIIRYLFKITLEASEKLHADAKFQNELKEAIASIPPNQIGSDGRLMEWLEEYKEVEPTHRHVSHLWGLYPGDEINSNTPELMEAARKSLYARGDNATGWSSAWKINFWSRLKDGEKALQLLQTLLKPALTIDPKSEENQKPVYKTGAGTYPNLFCAHPPFQIDGNFGGTAGIAEMLIQSHEGYISFLPALPEEWNKGSFNGLRVRGGAEISLDWENGAVRYFDIISDNDNEFIIQLSDIDEDILQNIPEVKNYNNNFLTLRLKKGNKVSIKVQK